MPIIQLPPRGKASTPGVRAEYAQLCADDSVRLDIIRANFPRGSFTAAEPNGDISLVTPAVDGDWRVTVFDDKGWPLGHNEYETWGEAAEKAIRRAIVLGVEIPVAPVVDGDRASLLASLKAGGCADLCKRIYRTLVLFHRMDPQEVQAAT